MTTRKTTNPKQIRTSELISLLSNFSHATNNIKDDKDIPLIRLHVTSSIKIQHIQLFFSHANDNIKGDTVTGGFTHRIQKILFLSNFSHATDNIKDDKDIYP